MVWVEQVDLKASNVRVGHQIYLPRILMFSSVGAVETLRIVIFYEILLKTLSIRISDRFFVKFYLLIFFNILRSNSSHNAHIFKRE